MAAATHVLYPNEAELLIKEIKIGSLDQVGSKKWWVTHELVQKLNMQAVINVSSSADEFVKEFLVSYNKISVLIYDLIKSEVWTEKVFPYLVSNLSSNSNLSVYMTLFHEVTVLGLLETALFYKECCEAAGDELIDLVDYIQRKITNLLLKCIDGKKVEEGSGDDLENQNQNIQFTIQMKVISILRYISDHIDIIPLSVMNRILEKYDMPCMLVQLMENSPWKRINSAGKYQTFNDNKWCNVADNEKYIVSKIEGQVWITLYQLLMHPECQRKYDFNVYRKSQILKLRRYLNEVLLEQISFLKEFQRFIEMLSIMDPPQLKECLIIEQIPTIRLSIESQYKDKWEIVGQDQAFKYYTLTDEQMKERAQRLSTMYNFDVLENLIDEPPTCAHCHGDAMKRCSRCQNEWYCSRPCQVSHWNKHKEVCDMLFANSQKVCTS